MEEKINPEIRDYKSDVWWGFSLREIFSIMIALALAVPIYLISRAQLSTDAASWICIAVAAGPILFGFAKWHGMQAETIIGVLIKYLLSSGPLPYKGVNYMYLYYQPVLEKKRKEEMKHGAENSEADSGQP